MRVEAGAISHEAAACDRILRRVSRTHDGRAVADGVEAAAEAAFCSAGSGRDARSLSRCVSRLRRRTRRRRSNFALGCARFIEEKLFKTILAPEEVAAIFVEPVQGEGGYVVAPKVFMQELRRICDRHGIMLVVDEVQSGIGRTGKWWAVEHTGVEPDMVCMAKGIASGMPLGITMTRAEIMDWVPGSHASTFGGNPVAVAAALATLDVIEKEHLIENSPKSGKHIMKRMADWPSKLKLVGDVRGRGLMIGVEIVKDKVTKEYGAAERDRIVEMAFERGILFLGCGPSTVRLCPPLIVTKEEADVAIDVLEECIKAVGA